ncbi:hypothetical protein E2C01_052208 [Portunus trituberculatus]|uniref:Uncharacterized protein n=1 Tax=Portunus trituberculatus TaxID=210409 RepID=A0A5B7GL90_PORTR|nr:hypothetical protein [Portunus trituberculatus]
MAKLPAKNMYNKFFTS